MRFNNRRFRWVLEPAVGVLIVLLAVALNGSNNSTVVGVMGISTGLGVAVARIAPRWALGGVLLTAAIGATAGRPSFPSLLVIGLGATVVFGTVAIFGTVRQRWVAFAGATSTFLVADLYFVSKVVTTSFSSGPYISRPTDFAEWLETGGVVALLSPLIIGVMALMMTGPWFFGQRLRRRIGLGRRPSDFVGWLAAPVSSNFLARFHPPLFRPMTMTQLRIDGAVALGFVAVALLLQSYGPVRVVIGTAIFAIALGLRRWSPQLALAVCWLAVLEQFATLSTPQPAYVVGLFVLYGTASYGRRRVRWAGLISVVAWAVILPFQERVHEGTSPHQEFWKYFLNLIVPNFIALGAVLGLSWTAGLLARTWREARRSRLAERAEHFRREQAESVAALEHERNQIARDVHDVVAHSLAVIIAQSDGARYLRKSDPAAVDVGLRAIAATSRDALADVRVLLSRLRHDETEGPAPSLDDIDRVVDQIRSSGLVVEVVRSGVPVLIAPSTQLAVFRIVQEALTNALRHGDARDTVRVTLEWTSTGLAFSIVNAISREVAAQTSESRGGHGLDGMRERAFLVGGHLRAEEKDHRFTVEGFVPSVSHATKLLAAENKGKDAK